MSSITLETDGNASLLTRRGELAHLSQFSYRGLQEIITAIQSGATALAELEKNPPMTESASPAIVADVPETATEITLVYSQIDKKGQKKNARPYYTDAECAALARRVKWPECVAIGDLS